MTRTWLGSTSLGLVLALAGCPNPNMYTSPRTLDPGTVQWQVTAEGLGVDYKANRGSTDASGKPIGNNVSAGFPVLPTFGVRFGAAEGLEVGLRLPDSEPFAVDTKIRLLKGPIDVALDPGLQVYLGTTNNNSFAALYLQAPVLLGFNFSEDVSLVLSPELAYADNTGASNVYPTGVAGSSTAAGFLAGVGVGFDFRASRRLAVQPEVTIVRQFTGSQDLLLCVAGIGFNFGAQPDYSDLASAPKPSEPEPLPPAPSMSPEEPEPARAPPPSSAPSPPAQPAPSAEPPSSSPGTDVKL